MSSRYLKGAMSGEQSNDLFKDVVYSIIPSDDYTVTDLQYLEKLAVTGGRIIELNKDDNRLEHLVDLTHVISTHADFPQYISAIEHGINVVKPSWVIQSILKGKVAQTRQHSPDPSQFFNDVVLTTAGLPEGDKDAIIAGVIAMGGQYSGALSKLVTHIVTLDPQQEKCRIAREKVLNISIVLPHWFDDCFKLGKKISEGPYLFPDPEILRAQHGLKIKSVASPHVVGATTASPLNLPSSTPASSPSTLRKTLNALTKRKLYLSADLGLNEHLRMTLEQLINQSGGSTINDIHEADIYIGHYRDGKDYITASHRCIEVANLSWLYHVINRNLYSNPLSKLLHYPVPRGGLRGFDNMKISVSNYQGDARVYLENLILHCGAEYTKTMKQDNTHLITAHMNSDKVEAAQEWGLNIVNHIWLEESYAKCAVQPLTNPRYLTFPARTNLGEVTGQTSFDMKRVERMFFPRDTTQTANHESGATIAPQISSHIGAREDPPTADDSEQQATSAGSAVKKPRGRPSKQAMTPKPREDEKENVSPFPMSSGRASKNKALGLLHEQATDIALFNKEMKRRGGVTHGGRRSDHPEDLTSPITEVKSRKKRTSTEANEDSSDDSSEANDSVDQVKVGRSKRTKHSECASGLPPIKYRVMVTGDERWVNNAAQESKDRAKLRQLGIQLIQDPKRIDVLVAPKILRTRKFVSALAAAPHVASTQYLDFALAQGKLMEELPLLEDPETEERYGFRLTESLERARSNKGKLLRDWSILVTKQIPGGFDTYKDIISINGGTAMAYSGRMGLKLRNRADHDTSNADIDPQDETDSDDIDYVYLVSGTSEAEIKLWQVFADQCAKQNLQPRIVSPDWLLIAAMSQQVTWDDSWAHDFRSGGS